MSDRHDEMRDASAKVGDSVTIRDGVPLRGAHGRVRTGVIASVTMEEPRPPGAITVWLANPDDDDDLKVGGPFYPGEYEVTRVAGKAEDSFAAAEVDREIRQSLGLTNDEEWCDGDRDGDRGSV